MVWARKQAKKRPKSNCTLWCNNKLNFFRALFDFTCTFCNRKFDAKYLDMVHVGKTPLSGTGSGRGKYQRVKDILEHPESYTIGCMWCHRKFDHPIDESIKKEMEAKIVTLEDKLRQKQVPCMVVCVKSE